MQTLADLTERKDALGRARAFVQFAICRALAPDTPTLRAMLAARLGPRDPNLELFEKAATAAVTTGGASALTPIAPAASAFLELVARRSLLGRLVGLRRVPFHTRVPIVASGTAADFVGQGAPIPASALSMGAATLTPAKLAVVISFTRETLESADPTAVGLVERDLVRAIARGEDAALLDGAAAVPDVRPASVLYGLSPVGAGSPSDVEADVLALIESVRDGEAEAPAFIVSPRGAVYLAGVRSSGVRVFPDIGMTGGSLYGAPVLVSAGAADRLVLIDAAALAVADAGVEIGAATQTTLQLDTAPNDAPTSRVVSMWQANLAAFRAIRTVNWELGRADGCGFISLPLGSPV